ncbi:hypothetical protein ACFRAO_42795 [Streptomyces sp. NPDC056656]|uniref:hypothetical protein n=1 Tax=Streptomyces sp. NPDC056656 TaxID=3345895 RepID=UPI00368A5A97
METTTGYPTRILETYRRRVENDLWLIENERQRIEARGPRDAMELDRLAAIQQVEQVLLNIRMLLAEAHDRH